MEFRTEYDLTLSQVPGRALVRALVEYNDTVLGSHTNPGSLPTTFEVPGVLRIDNLVIIEGHSYSEVPNPVRTHIPLRPDPDRLYAIRHDPRDRALSEENAIHVQFVVWQRAPESVNT